MSIISNDDTIVAAFGYAGDAHQIKMLMPYYLHHNCTVVVLSPEDSAITHQHVAQMKEIKYRYAGKRAYTGLASLERQVLQLKALLEFPAKYFLLNDSDSVCLSPKIPEYLYRELPCVWSNEVSDVCHPRAEDYKYPRLAFQPPYFLRREHIEALIKAAPLVDADKESASPNGIAEGHKTLYIDWGMMAWTIKALLPHKTFYDGVSCPSNDANPPAQDAMANAVQNEGKVMIHSVKTLHMLKRIAYGRLAYKKAHGLK